MSKKVLIACDSTSDLSCDLLARYGIKVLPLGITLGAQQYKDGVDITPKDIFSHFEKTGELPKTSAVNIGEFSDFFAHYTAEGYAIVLFTISAELSSTYQNACLAAAEFEDVHVVDTRNLCNGGGLLVLAGGDMAKAGRSAAEIAEACRALAARVDVSFVINSLEFLHKGGRCSALAALGANLLHLKPSIVVRDGKMSLGKKYRGSYESVLRQYISDRLADAESLDRSRIFITHAGLDEDIYRKCVDQVKSLASFDEIICSDAGCTISSHCGKNAFSLMFLRKADIV